MTGTLIAPVIPSSAAARPARAPACTASELGVGEGAEKSVHAGQATR